jgi:hypothetical protein
MKREVVIDGERYIKADSASGEVCYVSRVMPKYCEKFIHLKATHKLSDGCPPATSMPTISLRPGMKIRITTVFKCSACGALLDAVMDKDAIAVDTCDACMAAERKYGYEEGYDEGYDDAESAAE